MKPIIGPVPTLAGYDLLAEMSSGGMGRVLLARRRSGHGFEKLFAIKTIRVDLAPDERVRTMFLDEARLVARLNHSSIAQVVDFGDSDETLFMVMELVRGIPIWKLIGGELPPLAIRATCELAADLCRGLHSAHEVTDADGETLGVVHRDVSPQNVLLTFDGAVKVIDFGIAMMRDRVAPTTQAGQIKGKPSYMSPEQLNDSRVDRRTDIFAASTILHELLTGGRLFMRSNVGATITAVLTDEIAPPSDENPDVSPALDALLMRGLERNRDRRWNTALEMAQALDEIIRTEDGASLEEYALANLGTLRSEYDDTLRDFDFSDERRSTLIDGRGESEVTIPPRDSIEEEGSIKPAARSTRRQRESPLVDPRHAPANRATEINTTEVLAAAGLRPKRMLLVLTLAGMAIGLGAAFAIVQTGLIQVSSPTPPDVLEQPQIRERASTVPAPQPNPPEPTRSEPNKHRRSKRKRRTRPVEPAAAAIEPNDQLPRGRGSLNVFADPFARVQLDGVYIGDTPVLGHEVEEGEHDVRLISPDTGRVRLQRKVTIRPNDVTTVAAR